MVGASGAAAAAASTAAPGGGGGGGGGEGEGAGAAAGGPRVALADLEAIENTVVDCVDTAAKVAGLLADASHREAQLGAASAAEEERTLLELCSLMMAHAKSVQTGLHAAVEAHVECKPFVRNDFVAKKRAEITARKAAVVRRRLQAMRALLAPPAADPAAMDES